MSDTELSAPIAEVPGAQPQELPVPFKVFAAMHKARRVPHMRNGKQAMHKGKPVFATVAGSPFEVWLKFLSIQHGNERHSPKEWEALIAQYANEPAHPSGPRMAR